MKSELISGSTPTLSCLDRVEHEGIWMNATILRSICGPAEFDCRDHMKAWYKREPHPPKISEIFISSRSSPIERTAFISSPKQDNLTVAD